MNYISCALAEKHIVAEQLGKCFVRDSLVGGLLITLFSSALLGYFSHLPSALVLLFCFLSLLFLICLKEHSSPNPNKIFKILNVVIQQQVLAITNR